MLHTEHLGDAVRNSKRHRQKLVVPVSVSKTGIARKVFTATNVQSMAANDPVLYEVNDGVALLTLNRPDRLNAYTEPMATQLYDYVDTASQDHAVGVIVITGAGRGWCAGADMDVLQSVGSGESVGSEGGAGGGQRETRTTKHLVDCPKLTIAAINGPCAGIGLAMALACDLRFSVPEAKFTAAFPRRGLIAEHGMSWTLPNLVGQSNALDIIISGRVFLGSEAKEMGMVNRVEQPDKLMDATMEYARDVVSNVSPTSMAVMKHQIYTHPLLPLPEAMDHSIELMLASLRRKDFVEGVDSFLEKREPRFNPMDNEALEHAKRLS